MELTAGRHRDRREVGGSGFRSAAVGLSGSSTARWVLDGLNRMAVGGGEGGLSFEVGDVFVLHQQTGRGSPRKRITYAQSHWNPPNLHSLPLCHPKTAPKWDFSTPKFPFWTPNNPKMVLSGPKMALLDPKMPLFDPKSPPNSPF